MVGWEGADWRLIAPLIESGCLPHLSDLINRGVMGSILSPLPMVCPIVWTSIATGVLGDKHDILTPVEPDGRGDVRPVQSTSRRRKAIWNILNQSGLRSVVVGWPVTHPAEHINGVVVSDRFPHTSGPAEELWPADGHTVHPGSLLEQVMDLRVRPRDLSYEQLAEFVPRLSEIDATKDPRVGAIATLLAQSASVQNAATWVAEHEPWDFMAVYYGLLGGLCHSFIKYHPPVKDSVDKKYADLFGKVVETGYRFCDMMLGRLVQLVEPDTHVFLVSDHGFYRDPIPVAAKSFERRPHKDKSGVRFASLRYHRRDTVFCAAGPNMKADELVFGAELIDVAPTILASFGLAVPEDIDGKVLKSLFLEPPEPKSVSGYEPYSTDDGIHNRELTEDTWAAQAIVENLSAFSLVSLAGEAAIALEICARQRLVHLADIYVSQKKFEDALDVSRKLSELDDSFLTRVPVVECLINLNRMAEAEAMISGMGALAPDAPLTLLLWTRYHTQCGNLKSARDYLEKAESVDTHTANYPMQLGWLAAGLERWESAEKLFRRALDRDPDFAQAHDGLGVVLLRKGLVEDAVRHHEQAVRLLYNRSEGHVNLAESLIAAGEPAGAIRHLETALDLRPEGARALRLLERAKRLEAEADQGGKSG